MFRVARVQTEKSVKELAARLFKFEGEGANERAREAEAALLEANPQLRDLKNIPAGTFIIVPQVENVAFARGSKPFAAEELAKHLRSAVKGIRHALETSATRQAEGAQATLDLLKTKEVKASAKKDQGVKEQVAAVTDEMKARLKGVKENEKLRDKVVEQINTQVENILKSLG